MGIIKKNLKSLLVPLKEVSFPLTDEDKRIITDLKDTASATPCAGIAANQIGYDKKIFIGLTNVEKNQFGIFINPKISGHKGNVLT